MTAQRERNHGEFGKPRLEGRKFKPQNTADLWHSNPKTACLRAAQNTDHVKLAQRMRLRRILLQVEHCPPDRNPSIALGSEHPQVTTGRMIPSTRTLVNHLVSKRDYSRITCGVNLIIMVPEFVNSRVLTKIAESIKKGFTSFNAAGETGKNHYNFRVHHRPKALDLAVQPDPVDSAYCRDYSFVFGFFSHRSCVVLG